MALKVTYFSDVLCIWAYCAQARLDGFRRKFADDIAVEYRFIPVFGSTSQKIGAGWADRGGFEAYARHVREVARRFDHVEVHAGVWEATRPASSSAPHLFLKAIQVIEGPAGTPSPAGGLLERSAWALRQAFFREGRDIARTSTQMEVAEAMGVPVAQVEALLADGRAIAALFEDVEAQARHKIEGSPTFLLNDGRQKLYGNVGYRVIEANLQELMRAPDLTWASWC